MKEMTPQNQKAFDRIGQRSFADKLDAAKLRLALLKENFEYREWFDRFLEWYEEWHKYVAKLPVFAVGFAEQNEEFCKRIPSEKRAWRIGEFNRFGLVGVRWYAGGPNWKHVLDLINPHKDTGDCPAHVLKCVLPRLFYAPSIQGVEVGGRLDVEACSSIFIERVVERGLKPWERLVKVDLRRRKADILKELEGFIDRASLLNTAEGWWIPDTKRGRVEAWGHLAVWKLRRQRRSFRDIARTLNGTADAAKKRFYRAYELTQGRQYDPEAHKREVCIVKEVDVAQTCKTCPQRDTCGDLCPDMLRIVDQDQVTLRERLLADPSDSLRDTLIRKNR
jgi:hypothetical protein